MRIITCAVFLITVPIALAADTDRLKELQLQQEELKRLQGEEVRKIVETAVKDTRVSAPEDFKKVKAKVDARVQKSMGISLSDKPDMERIVDGELLRQWDAIKAKWDDVVGMRAVAAAVSANTNGSAADKNAKSPAESKAAKDLEKLGPEEWTKWFGAGLGLTFDIGEHTRVKSAHLELRSDARGDYKQVVVDEDRDVIARPIMEAHYYFQPEISFFGLPKSYWGTGPFVMTALGGDSIISAAGAGWMIGWRRRNIDNSFMLNHFNLGVAYTVDFDVRVLADGYGPGDRLATTIEEIKFRNTHQSGLSLIFSIGW